MVQRSCPHTSQHNGQVEYKYRHILDFVHVFLLSASCPKKIWGEAALTAIYCINRVPTLVLQNLSPFEKLFGKPPDYSILEPFGCACFVLVQPH